MNKVQINFEKCKRIAGTNTKCLSILLKLLDNDRSDILDQISKLNKIKYNCITAEGIVALYERSNEDLNKFIATYDKAMESADYIHKNFYDDYQKGMDDFCNNR